MAFKPFFIGLAFILTGIIGVWLGIRSGTLDARKVADIDGQFGRSDAGWAFSKTIGSAASSRLERARIALGGPLALSSEETIYFLSTEDSTGTPYDSSCTYEVAGRPFDARWWSIAIYDGTTQQYIDNEDNRSSWNSNALLENGGEEWRITIAPQRPAIGRWLPSQPTPGQTFELLIRLYNPSKALRSAAPDIELPIVEPITC